MPLILCSGNLGQLSRFATTDAPIDWTPDYVVSPESFANRGLYADSSTIFASSVLLFILIFLSVWRIFGWERYLFEWQE